MAKKDTDNIRIINKPLKWWDLISLSAVIISLAGVSSSLPWVYNLSIFYLWVLVLSSLVVTWHILIRDSKIYRIRAVKSVFLFMIIVFITLIALGHWIKAIILIPWLFIRGAFSMIELWEKIRDR